jgi:hypothetical protein
MYKARGSHRVSLRAKRTPFQQLPYGHPAVPFVYAVGAIRTLRVSFTAVWAYNDNWEISKMRVTNKEIDRKRVLDTREDFP